MLSSRKLTQHVATSRADYLPANHIDYYSNSLVGANLKIPVHVFIYIPVVHRKASTTYNFNSTMGMGKAEGDRDLIICVTHRF